MDRRLWVALCRFAKDQIEALCDDPSDPASRPASPETLDPEDPLVFSRFCVYLAVHHLDLPVVHYDDAITEGRGELGFDGIVIAVENLALGNPEEAAAAVAELLDGRQLRDTRGEVIETEVPRPRILFVQVKREQVTPVRELDHFGASAHRFLILDPARFRELRPNEGVARWREVYDRIRAVYEERGLPFLPQIELIFAYAGVWSKDLVPEVAREAAEKWLRREFSGDRLNFRMWGADELLEAIAWAYKAVDGVLRGATLHPLPSGPARGYLGYAPASSIVDLMPVRDGRPDERVFLDNVRSFLGDSGEQAEKVNPGAVGLLETLERGEADQVLLRHNGLTLTARRLEEEADGALRLHEFQIVNGAQTAFVLFRNRERIGGAMLPLKIVVTEDDDIKDGVILGANTQSLVSAYDMLARRREVRALQLGFEAFGRERPEKLWMQRRRREWVPRDAYADFRFVTLRHLMEAFAAAYLGAPHRVHGESGSLLRDVPEKIFHGDHSPSVYRAMGWLNVTGRRWAARHGLVWVDHVDARGPKAYPARHQFALALWILVDVGPAETGLSRSSHSVTKRFEAACRRLAGPEGVALGDDAAAVVAEAAGAPGPNSANVRTKEFTERVREVAGRWKALRDAP